MFNGKMGTREEYRSGYLSFGLSCEYSSDVPFHLSSIKHFASEAHCLKNVFLLQKERKRDVERHHRKVTTSNDNFPFSIHYLLEVVNGFMSFLSVACAFLGDVCCLSCNKDSVVASRRLTTSLKNDGGRGKNTPGSSHRSARLVVNILSPSTHSSHPSSWMLRSKERLTLKDEYTS